MRVRVEWETSVRPVSLDKHPDVSSLGLWYHGHLIHQALQPTTLFPPSLKPCDSNRGSTRLAEVTGDTLFAQDDSMPSLSGAILRACLAFHKDILFVLVCWYNTMIGSITKTAPCCIFSWLLGSGKKTLVILWRNLAYIVCSCLV